MTYLIGEYIKSFDKLRWQSEWTFEEILGVAFEGSDGILGFYSDSLEPNVSYYINVENGKVVCVMIDKEDENLDTSYEEWSDSLK